MEHKQRSVDSKWQRVPINRDNDKQRKWVYICYECNRQVFDIKRHMRSRHTKERPYSCPECSRGFFESSACVNHLKVVHASLENLAYKIELEGKLPYVRSIKKKKLEATATVTNENGMAPSAGSTSALSDDHSEIGNIFRSCDCIDFETLLNQEFPFLEETPIDNS